MARCRCTTSEGCTCALQAGDNILVSGSGSPGDPWIVSLESTVAPGVIAVGPGLVGDGSAGNPLRICLVTYDDLKSAGNC